MKGTIMTIKEGDFVILSYTGKDEEGFVFDTTDASVAKKEKIFRQEQTYGDVTVCVGQKQVLQGLDEGLVGKKEDDAFSVKIEPEKGFGKKSAKNIRLLPVSKFREQNISLHPGMQVNVDNNVGIVKTVTGGRTLVDFNHPLAGKNLVYDVTIKGIEKDTEKKIDSILSMQLPNVKTEVTDNSVTLTLPFDLGKEFEQMLDKNLKKLIPEITTITFNVEQAGKKNG